MWNQFSLNKKVISAFVVISVLVAVTSWIGMSGINRLSGFIENTLTEKIAQSQVVNAMSQHLLRGQDATGEFLSTTNLAELKNLRREFNAEMAVLDEDISRAQGMQMGALEAELLTEMVGLKDAFTAATGQMMNQWQQSVKAGAKANELLIDLTRATPKMLAAARFAGVSREDEALITRQVLAAFNYIASRNLDAAVEFDRIGKQVTQVNGYADFAPVYDMFIEIAHDAIMSLEEQKTASDAAYAAMDKLDAASLGLQERTEKLLAQQAREIGAAQAEAADIRVTTGRMMMTMSVVAVLLSMLIGALVSRAIVGPLVQAIEQLKAGSIQLEQSSSEISRASMQQAEGASEQAASIQETSATMTELTEKTQQNAEDAMAASELAAQTRDAATSGNRTMSEMAEAMRAIHVSSNEIAKVINVIDDIAFQTNILALNAAVEAARAGEAGMGFAVVADEVRNLAQRSAAAAKDTSAMISESIARATRGVEITETAGQALAQITDRAMEMSGLVERIAEASTEQSSGINQVTQAMQQMEQVTQQGAASAEKSATSSEELNGQVTGMRSLVATMDVLVWGRDGAPDTPSGHTDSDDGPSDWNQPDAGAGPVVSPLRAGTKPDELELF